MEKRCGTCGRQIYKEQPAFTVTITGVKRTLVRCADCAGEPVPADLPELERATPVALTAFGTAVVDFKKRAGGEE